MKRGFDANVSRAKPRMRLGAVFSSEGLAAGSADEATTAEAVSAGPGTAPSVAAHAATGEARSLDAGPTSPPDAGLPALALGQAVRARAHEVAHRPTAAARLQQAVSPDVVGPTVNTIHHAGSARAPTGGADESAGPAVNTIHHVPTAHAPAAESPAAADAAPLDEESRRHRLKERLRAVREHPRVEPLPETVALAGSQAVERIATLQAELVKVRAQNEALGQALAATRRTSERAVDEARTRMDEARRLAQELETRAALLAELEKELEALEGERNEALLAVQDARRLHADGEAERRKLEAALAARGQALADSLKEEERLAAELEAAVGAREGLERTVAALESERAGLAAQVASLSAERQELLEARKALEAVHRALTTVR